MTDLMHGYPDGMRDVAARLDPAAVGAAKEAAAQAKEGAAACSDQMPGCARFTTSVARVADDIIAFCTEAETGVPAYASVLVRGAGNYDAAEAYATEAVSRGTR